MTLPVTSSVELIFAGLLKFTGPVTERFVRPYKLPDVASKVSVVTVFDTSELVFVVENTLSSLANIIGDEADAILIWSCILIEGLCIR